MILLMIILAFGFCSLTLWPSQFCSHSILIHAFSSNWWHCFLHLWLLAQIIIKLFIYINFMSLNHCHLSPLILMIHFVTFKKDFLPYYLEPSFIDAFYSSILLSQPFYPWRYFFLFLPHLFSAIFFPQLFTNSLSFATI